MRSDYTLCVLRYCALIVFTISMAAGQEPEPRSHAADYPVHIQLGSMELGAEFLGHSLPTDRGMIVTDGYLVVEVAAFPVAQQAITIRSGRFTLRLNHGKSALPADAPGMVASSLKVVPDWQQPQGQRRPPASGDPNPNAANAPAPMTIDQVVARAALPEGVFKEHVRGCLFFPYEGKLKKIQSVELLIESEPGKDSISLILR